jgi:two-component system, cell cycle sensor histidine kinase and response regulator CckA
MSPLPRHSRPPATGDELIAALRRYARDRATASGAEDAADVELALIQFQKLATIGELASEVAHDFGNLMTVVLGYSELMLAAAEQGQAPEHEYLAELRRAAERASTLTTRLLGYSHHSADEPAPLDLSLLVGSLRAMLTRLLSSGATLVIRTDATAGAILADTKQIEQLIINLILNARDAIAGGGQVELAVDAIHLTAPLPGAILPPVSNGGVIVPGDYIRLRVRDDGCGMGPDTIARLFQPFFTTKGRGTGLGLTVVARVASKTNAAVLVDSAPGKGTTFDMLFPRLGDDALGNGRA